VTLDNRYANKLARIDSTTIYPKAGHKLLYTRMTVEIKFLLDILMPCAIHSIFSKVDATHPSTPSQII
jgi:hypothetical protein